MKSVLISIQPKWCELIACLLKTVEIRKNKPKIDTPFKCYIYETKTKDYYSTFHKKTMGKVIGEFVCDHIREERGPIYGLCDVVLEKTSCVKFEDIIKYANGKSLFSWHISDLVIYDEPKELSEFVTHCKYEFDDDFEHCENCQHYYYSNTSSCGIEEYCGCDGLKPVTRPPQSWCYVEERSA